MLFVGLFFIALGMGLDLGHLWKNIWIIAGGAAGLVAVKFAAIFIAARIRGTSNRQGFLIALILAQGGEFGLLLLQTIKIGGIGVLPAEHAEILTAVIILSMALSTLALSLYDKLNEKGLLYSLKKAYKYDSTAVRPHVLICGFGRVGMTIAKMLSLRGIPYIAIDMDVDRVADGRDAGFNAVYGDTTRGDILAQFGLAPRMTRAAIVALDNAAVAKKTVRAIRQIAPRVKIFARARNLSESKILISEGARVALPETIESSFLLGHGVLAEMGASEREIKSIMSKMRGNDYEVISGILAR
jgi:voltage-gated potassium channel Kch